MVTLTNYLCKTKTNHMESNPYHPFNVFKFCPRCGLDVFKPLDSKSFFCGACSFVYYINPAPAVIAVITNQNQQVLFARRKHDPGAGTLDLPGGFVDCNETAEQAVRREVKEEVNLDVDGLTYLGTYTNQYYYKGILYFTTDLAFSCQVANTNPIIANDDVASVEWHPLEEVDPECIGLGSVKQLLIDLQQGKVTI
jgi:mutator protein MutT